MWNKIAKRASYFFGVELTARECKRSFFTAFFLVTFGYTAFYLFMVGIRELNQYING